MAEQVLEKSTSPQCNDPASRAAIEKRDTITDISSGNTCFDRKVVKSYTDICKGATKESKLMLEGCKDALLQCQSLARDTAQKRYQLRYQLIENIINRNNQDNEHIIQQILKSGQTIKELKELHIKFANTEKQWQAKHILNKLLTRVAWLNLDYIRAAEIGEKGAAINEEHEAITFQRELVLLKVNGNIVRRELENALTSKETELGAEEVAIITELVAVMQSLPL